MNNLNNQLRSLLKKKGIGPEMGKHLNPEELSSLKELFLSKDCHLTTKATLLTALLTLDPTQDEDAWLTSLYEKPSAILPSKLIDFLPNASIQYHKKDNEKAFLSVIKEIISGKNLSKDEFKQNFALCLDASIPDYLKAAFLEAERLKRETFEENMGCLEVLWEKCPRKQSNMPILIDIANSYDGFNRNPHITIFTAALLGSMGFPTLVHGVKEVAPKNGLTAHKLLDYFGKSPLKPMDFIMGDLEDPEISWGYLDQSVYFPELYALNQLRTDMVKRPILATMEKIIQPIRAQNGNLLVTGYTHPAYKQMLSTVLKEHNASPTSLLVRGLEGSAQLPIDRQAPILTITKNKIQDEFVRPEDYRVPEIGFSKDDNHFTEQRCMDEGLLALQNKSGPIRNLIAYNAAVILSKFSIMDKRSTIPAIQENLKNMRALEAFENG